MHNLRDVSARCHPLLFPQSSAESCLYWFLVSLVNDFAKRCSSLAPDPELLCKPHAVSTPSLPGSRQELPGAVGRAQRPAASPQQRAEQQPTGRIAVSHGGSQHRLRSGAAHSLVAGLSGPISLLTRRCMLRPHVAALARVAAA